MESGSADRGDPRKSVFDKRDKEREEGTSASQTAGAKLCKD
jgi:hypothetical protein